MFILSFYLVHVFCSIFFYFRCFFPEDDRVVDRNVERINILTYVVLTFTILFYKMTTSHRAIVNCRAVPITVVFAIVAAAVIGVVFTTYVVVVIVVALTTVVVSAAVVLSTVVDVEFK